MSFARPKPTFMNQFVRLMTPLVLSLLLSPLMMTAQMLELEIVWPQDIVEDCELSLDDIDPGMPMLVAPDTCSTDTITFVDAYPETDCAQNVVIERTWTLSACGVDSSHVQTISFLDTTPPELHPQTIAQIGEHFCVTEPTYWPFFIDNCEPDDVIGFVLIRRDTICPGVVEMTIEYESVTDHCGNQFSGSHNVFMHEYAPEFESVPEDVTVQCGVDIVFEEPEYGDCHLTYTSSDGYSFPGCGEEVITRTFSLTNLCSQTTTATQSIFIVDTIGPSIVMPADFTAGCGDMIAFDDSDIQVANGCGADGEIILTTQVDTLQLDCGIEIIRTATATDECGNTSTASQSVMLVDTIGPTFLHVPANASLACADEATMDALLSEMVVAEDACSSVTITESTTIMEGDCPNNYTMVRSFTAVDGCGNARIAEQLIEVYDDVAPVVTFDNGMLVDSLELSCEASLPAPVLMISEDCSTTTTSTSVSVVQGSCDGNVVKDYTITVSDACGNATALQRVVTVIDTVAPVFTGPAELTISCEESLPTDEPEVMEGCSFIESLGFVEAMNEGACPNAMAVVRTWTATDACGNTSVFDQTIHVIDATPPVIVTALPDLSIGYESGLPFGLDALPAAIALEATDNCSDPASLMQASSDSEPDTTMVGDAAIAITVIRTYTVTDPCGNAASTSQTWTLDLAVAGCTDTEACNFDAIANEDDGSCTYPEAYYDCQGACLVDTDGDGVCDELEILGCTDASACNYDASATEEDNSCVGPEASYDCAGECLNDADADGVCDELEVDGCDDITACNFSLDATENDGTCEFPLDNVDCNGDCLEDVDGDGVCDPVDDCVGDYDNCGVCNGDNSLCTGCDDVEACNYAVLSDGMWSTNFGLSNDPEVKTITVSGNDGDYQFDGVLNTLAIISGSPTIIHIEFSGTFLVGGVEAVGTVGADIPAPSGLSELPGESTFMIQAGSVAYEVTATLNDNMGESLSGTVNGFSLAAISDAASCEYPSESYVDCDGACLSDADGDGVCDEAEVPGCTDDSACNYNPSATDAGDSCAYAEEYYDCTGQCLLDADGDGICDELETEGCTDALACNYLPSATESDESCTYPEFAYNCEGTCLNDTDGDGVCDELEVPGCVDSSACNYDASATEADDSCVFAETYVDCDGVCLEDMDMDGVCDPEDPCVGEFDDCGVCNGDNTLCYGCLDDAACNYDVLSEGEWFTNFGLDNNPAVKTLHLEGVEGDYTFDGELMLLELNQLPGSTDVVHVVFEGTLVHSNQAAYVQIESYINLSDGIENPPVSSSFYVLAGEAVYTIVATRNGDISQSLSGAIEPFSLTYFSADPSTCVYPEPYTNCEGEFIPSSVCGEGTVFDVATGLCLPASECVAGPNACGEFTVWDEASQQCVPEEISAACYYDVNNTGLVDTQDLIEFLAAFGATCE